MASPVRAEQRAALMRRRDAGRRVAELFESDHYGRRSPGFTYPPLSVKLQEPAVETSRVQVEEAEAQRGPTSSLAELNGTVVEHKGEVVYTLCAPSYSTATAFDDAKGTVRVAKPNNWRVDRKVAAAMSEERAEEARRLLENMRVATQLDAETTSPRTDKVVVQEDPSVGTSSMGLATNNYKKQAAHQRHYSPARTTASARRHSVLGDSAATVFRGVPRCASARPARMSAAATLASLPPPRRPTSAASCPGGVYRRPRSGRSVSQLSYADVRSPVAERIRRSPSTNSEPPPPRELVYEGFCRAQNILNRDMLAH